MIEKFLDKFLPQITERLNENEEVGKALIEALAVLDNYATINNVQFTDEQVNSMLGIVPEPEPNADIPAEIIQAEETDWTWRFKTKEELIGDYDASWRSFWGSDARDYLFGQPIPKTPETEEFIEEVIIPKAPTLDVDTETLFGISSPTGENWWGIDDLMITDKPLPKNAWSWRFKTQEELENEFGTNWRNESNFVTPNMDYLLGKSIKETDASKNLIEKYFSKKVNVGLQINPYEVFGISRKEGNDKEWVIFGNNITNQPLPTAAAWSWRFKTQKELREEFGDSNWRKRWGGNMRDYLFGKSIPETPETIDFIDKVINKDLGIDVDTASLFGISNPNNSSATYFLFDKDNVTDKPLTWNWRFKTMEEFEEDYGDNWESKVGWINPNMNYLIGQKLKETFYTEELISSLEENNSNREKIEVEKLGVELIRKNLKDEWYVSYSMFTDKPLPTAVTPSTQIGWNWRFKTEQEFIDENGGALDWRDLVAGQWSPRMDYLLGQRIQENFISKSDIEYLENQPKGKYIDTADWGIDADKLGVVNPDNKWSINMTMLTQDPLPTAAAPAKSEPKKRGRKPKGTATTWTWRFKTEKELRGEYGGKPTGSIPVMGSFTSKMFYLFGKPIEENNVSKKFIKKLKNEPYTLPMDTKNLGISNGVEDTYWSISFEMITDKPLLTAAAPAKTEPKKRGRKPKSELPEIDLGGLEDIGDIDIDDIDFDNLVI